MSSRLRCRPLTVRRFHTQSDTGFSALELLMTIVIIGIVSAIALVQIGAVRQSLNGDSGMRVVLAQLNLARELSIAERRTVRLQFVNPNTLQIIRNDVPAGTTMLSSAVFEGGVEFALTPGVPDTPDAFGSAQSVDFGAALSIVFNSDGTLVDERGRTINGTVFLAVRGGRARSVRAITVLGSTGRIRAYRWSGAEWIRA
jgi:prepilin-type N-terminal cleavage/methylation domain-containing protein